MNAAPRVISASRRTDIPAFYMPWMLARLAAGTCRVPNPFRPSQVRTVSLWPDDVDAIVFWTRRPDSIARALPRLGRTGHRRIAALVTIVDNGSDLEPHVPARMRAADALRRLAEAIGPDAVRWRYDPIVLGASITADDHRERFERLAGRLEGATRRVIVSFVEVYRKTERRLRALGDHGASVLRDAGQTDEARSLLGDLVSIAQARGMTLATCALPSSFASEGVVAGRCLDPAWLGTLFPERAFADKKDRGQRASCGCMPSVDIGMTDTCLHGCVYCYATRTHEAALARHALHDEKGDAVVPASPSW